MKMLKVLGVTTLVSGAACLVVSDYNAMRWKNAQQSYRVQQKVKLYNPEKYNELKNANIEDLNVWREVELNLKDSIENVRSLESDACKSYFEGGKDINLKHFYNM